MSGRAAPDQSLADHRIAPTSHRGLTYPFGSSAPGFGELHEIAPGVGWSRMPVPFSLKHINVWTLDDGAGVALVDTGMSTSLTRETWDRLLGEGLGGRHVTRVFCTHLHPDHVGLAGWLCRRFGASLWMTRSEYLLARLLVADVRDAPPPEVIERMQLAGWPEALIEAQRAQGWGRFAKAVAPLPEGHVRMRDGDRIAIGGRDWTVFVGSGHSPEHACLVDLAGGLMIAGDQVLPRITSNVSVTLTEPEADPLGEWLASITRFRAELPADLLVLPSHGEPFTGLHARLDALAGGHAMQLDQLAAHIRAEPRRVVDCFGVLFGRRIDDSIFGLASGEALAHLRHLEVTGRAARETRDGHWWFSAA